jgi:predicted ABC-type ATPase
LTLPPTKPQIYIIAGPNGAGKTTFADEFLPHYAECDEFVNADLIAEGISPFAATGAAFRAGRLMLEQIHLLAQRRIDFAFETTLSGKSYLPLLRNFKGQGYTLHLFYLWLPSIELALARIADRVRQGGHNVPEAIVRRRFNKGLRNLFHFYRPLLNSWLILDNSTDRPRIIAGEDQGLLYIHDKETYALLSKGEDFQ